MVSNNTRRKLATIGEPIPCLVARRLAVGFGAVFHVVVNDAEVEGKASNDRETDRCAASLEASADTR
jgi:hypothetical protein